MEHKMASSKANLQLEFNAELRRKKIKRQTHRINPARSIVSPAPPDCRGNSGANNRQATIIGVAFKAQDQFDFAKTAREAGVDRVDHVRKVARGFDLSRPTTGGLQKLLGPCIAHEEFCR